MTESLVFLQQLFNKDKKIASITQLLNNVSVKSFTITAGYYFASRILSITNFTASLKSYFDNFAKILYDSKLNLRPKAKLDAV